MISFEPLQALLNKPMDRKQFLKHLLAIMVAMMGIGAFIRAVSNPLGDIRKQPKAALPSSSSGTKYGASGPYGA